MVDAWGGHLAAQVTAHSTGPAVASRALPDRQPTAAALAQGSTAHLTWSPQSHCARNPQRSPPFARSTRINGDAGNRVSTQPRVRAQNWGCAWHGAETWGESPLRKEHREPESVDKGDPARGAEWKSKENGRTERK